MSQPVSDFYLPDDSQHLLILGRNGSGKSRAAVWHLSQRNFDEKIWVVINHKREELINSIPGAEFMEMQERPKEPGLYIYQPRPEIDDQTVTDLLWWIYETENIGVYFDEVSMVNPRDPALNSLYTQGRSKKIPTITLSQRPSRISRYAISEAGFYQVFHLVDKRDRKTIQEFMPVDLESLMVPVAGHPRKLRDYHSVYYDTGRDAAVIMMPVPDDSTIIADLEEKLIIPDEENPENNQEYIGKFKFL